jgi:hypothetical protein
MAGQLRLLLRIRRYVTRFGQVTEISHAVLSDSS